MKKRRELIFFTAAYPFGSGETFIENEIPYLSRAFEKITIVPYSSPNLSRPRSVPTNVVVLDPMFDHSRIKVLLKEIFNRSPVIFILKDLIRRAHTLHFQSAWHFILQSLRIRLVLQHPVIKKILNDVNDNTVAYFYWGLYASQCIQFKKPDTGPFVVRFHRGDLYENETSTDIPIFYREQLLQSMTVGVFISEHGKKYLKGRYPNVQFNAIVSRLGVNDSGMSAKSADGVFRVLSCSNLIPNKRVDIIYHSLSLLKFHVEWTHIGDGALRDDLKNLFKDKPENLTIKMVGQVSNAGVISYYQNNSVDLFINTSETEGVPVSIMEALSFGVPVCATDVGGSSELVDESVGKLFEKNVSPESLSAFIREFASSPENHVRMKRENARRRWMERSDANRVYSDFSEYISHL